MAQDENRTKALNAALSQIDRQFGKGTVMRLGDTPRVVMPSVSTGSLGLDIALGIGGLPFGRVVEIFGPESSGKTTLTLSVIAQAQKQGKVCAFVDAEHALDPSSASTWMICWFRSPIPASRRWRSPTCWCAPVALMSSLSTPSPR
jgi:recombination protein RecA